MKEILQRLVDALHGEPRSAPVDQAYREANQFLQNDSPDENPDTLKES